ncbi:hypothetical protein LSAT2_028401 [Lamellibrachia satsuma]|nr:hypothetical protein LSAT2_028401 [Lamellibrachia satsuma]
MERGKGRLLEHNIIKASVQENQTGTETEVDSVVLRASSTPLTEVFEVDDTRLARLRSLGVPQVLIKLDKAFHTDAATTADEPPPALVRVRFTSKLLLLAERSALAD